MLRHLFKARAAFTTSAMAVNDPKQTLADNTSAITIKNQKPKLVDVNQNQYKKSHPKVA